MLDSAKKVLAGRIETMPEEALLALLEETFPYVSPFPLYTLWGQSMRLLNAWLLNADLIATALCQSTELQLISAGDQCQ